MKKELSVLLARAAVDEVETQHDAVDRVVKVLARAEEAEDAAAVSDGRRALYGLLASPQLAVVSKACHGDMQPDFRAIEELCYLITYFFSSEWGINHSLPTNNLDY